MIQSFIPSHPPRALLLVGAGASFGCGGLNATPPLGNKLDQELVSFSEYWASLPKTYTKAFDSGFERAFDYWKEASFERLKSPMLWHMAFYFDRFHIKDFNSCTYVALARAFIQFGLLNRVAIISLNYDTIFEQAFLSLGVSVRGWNNYYSSSLAWFIKPHGSSNFLPEQISTFSQGLSGTGGFISKYKWITPGQVRQEAPPPLHIATGIEHPIMAHYNRNKFARCGPDLIQALRNEWKQLATQAKIIVIVGVRPTIYDNLVWQAIARSPAKILFVNPSGHDRGEAQKIRSDMTMVRKSFDSALPEILSRIQEALST